MVKFNNWHDIKDWAVENGYKNIAKRLQFNNDAWMSSGEFGRSQKMICDSLRFAKTDEELHAVAKDLEKELSEDEVTKLI